MKKYAVLLTLALVLGLSGIVSAAGIEVTGGYLFGNYDAEGLIKCKANGFIVSGELPAFGPIGAKVNFASVAGDEFEVLGFEAPAGLFDMDVTRLDLLATYALPLSLPEGANLKAFGGYSTTTTNTTQPDEFGEPFELETKTNGFLVGAEGKFAVTDKISVNGLFGISFGMKSKTDGYADADTTLTLLHVSATYQLSDGISAEAGYVSNTFSEDDFEQKTSGFFVGARASF